MSRLIVLTEGHTDPHTAKTASCLLRYRGGDVVALLDGTQAGKTTHDLLGVGGTTPVVASLDAAPAAEALVLGIAPPGGKIPPDWRRVILEAIGKGMNVIGGLHDFLSDDQEFVQAAEAHQVELVDVRKNSEGEISQRKNLRDDCLRVLTVGHDCSVGKMLTTVELTESLRRRGRDAEFVATGQTGIMISGDGCPIDRVIADFLSGAVEKQILKRQHHEILMIEGQGSLTHPSYSAVSLGLMHGALPHALILCYEVGRTVVTGFDSLTIPTLAQVKLLNETMAGVYEPCPVIGISMNSRLVSAEEAAAERQRIRDEFGLPVCDVVRHGSDELATAVEAFRERKEWSQAAGCE